MPAPENMKQKQVKSKSDSYSSDNCDTCKYCKIQHIKRNQETYWKCRLLKYKDCWDKSIENFSVMKHRPSWCPLPPYKKPPTEREAEKSKSQEV